MSKPSHSSNEDWLFLPAIWGMLLLTFFWVLLGWVLLNIYDRSITLNEIGDFIAGWSAPVMLIWFVSAIFLQMRELKIARKAYSAQTEELRITSEANRRMVLQDQVNTLKSIVDDFMTRRIEVVEGLYDSAARIRSDCSEFGRWTSRNRVDFAGYKVTAFYLFSAIEDLNVDREIENLGAIPMANYINKFIEVIREQTNDDEHKDICFAVTTNILTSVRDMYGLLAEMEEIWEHLPTIYDQEVLDLILRTTGFGETYSFLSHSDKFARTKLIEACRLEQLGDRNA